jgi:hypothetical protein
MCCFTRPSIHRCHHSPTLVCGDPGILADRSIFSHIRAQPCSLECPKSHQHQHRHLLGLLTVNRILRLNCMSTVLQYARYCRSFLHLLYIHIITVPQGCKTTVSPSSSSKSVPTRVGHVHRPISAAGHALIPQSTNQRPCRTLCFRRFRS